MRTMRRELARYKKIERLASEFLAHRAAKYIGTHGVRSWKRNRTTLVIAGTEYTWAGALRAMIERGCDFLRDELDRREAFTRDPRTQRAIARIMQD